MPFVSRRGQRLHYTVEGTGPPVVLLHGLLLDAASWKRSGIVDTLAERFQTVCIDSLGHGLSDKPAEVARYDQKERASDVIAVLDAIGAEQAHVVGHSMGGWLAVGVAKFYPARLASLAVGGWDLLAGLPRGKAGPLSYETFMAFAKRAAPELTQWVTTDFVAGVRACFAALDQLDGAKEAVLAANVPVLLWNGRNDTPHDPMQRFAVANRLRFLSIAGDHLGMLFKEGAECGRGIRGFLELGQAR